MLCLHELLHNRYCHLLQKSARHQKEVTLKHVRSSLVCEDSGRLGCDAGLWGEWSGATHLMMYVHITVDLNCRY